jgi:hypothetical protein
LQCRLRSIFSAVHCRQAVLFLIVSAGAYGAPTYHKDIEPILQRHCQNCHRPGEIGPMSLITFADVRSWAQAIRQAVLLKKMPPWFVASSSRPLAGDPSLTKGEITAIDEWVRAGAPEGLASEAPPPRQWTQGWNISEPALIVEMPKPFPVPASGTVEYQFIVLPLDLREDRWVQMAEVRPSERGVVHHVVVYVREPGSVWLRTDSRRVTTSDILALYTPGSAASVYPAGMAKKIPAGSDLVLQIHYTPAGKAAPDRTRVGLVFAKQPPAKRVLTLQLNQTAFHIPPGEPNYRVSASGTLPNDALLLGFLPHMHLRGSAFEYEIVGEQGSIETLLRVKPYDFFWQLSYTFAEPMLLRKGTRLRATGWFDNSVNNPRNPDPSGEVAYGEQSWEEMMVGFFDVAVDAGIDKERFFVR